MNPVEIISGNGPLILGMPHTGTHIPAHLFERLNSTGKKLTDTDWHVDRLYKGLVEDVSIVRANFHRNVIDANRDPSGASLYPGQNTTGLCPLTDFDGEPIWQAGAEPDAAEVERRRIAFHAPYHAALLAEIERVKARLGIAVLYDCHSIRSRIPFLFEGELPDFNIGTNGGASCAPAIEAAAVETCKKATGYTFVLNGRFKGGWTTRHYGNPATGVHAIQMELAQKTHIESEAPPFAYDESNAEKLQLVLGKILKNIGAEAIHLARGKST